MKRSEAKKIIKKSKVSEYINSDVFEYLDAEINHLLEEQVKHEKKRVKNLISKKFNNDYSLAANYFNTVTDFS